MATFDDTTLGVATGESTPDYGAQRVSQPITRTVQFGDGYQQRLQFGLNQNPRKWELKWTAKTNSVSDAIESFFDARKGTESFDWTPLDEATALKWVCRSWNRTFDYPNINTITATFEQVFEP